jgi:tRNA-Thr(GGU) m(6)t(6)A37 methyltransferase TsaA
VRIERLDHLVLTATDLDATVAFYVGVLGMTEQRFAGDRRAVRFGAQKINLHQAGREHEPKARRATPGAVDICLITETPLAEVVEQLTAAGVEIEAGPGPRTGARGPIESVYVRDPDQNLVEISTYSAPDRTFDVRPVGWVESPLLERGAAPRQGDEGAPDAWLVFVDEVAEGIRDIAVGAEVLVLTWLDRASRDTLEVRPRGEPDRPLTGVFSTRSPDRPNPIGLHRVQVAEVDGLRIRVHNLEALDGTPVLDVKPVLERLGER